VNQTEIFQNTTDETGIDSFALPNRPWGEKEVHDMMKNQFKRFHHFNKGKGGEHHKKPCEKGKKGHHERKYDEDSARFGNTYENEYL